MRSFWFIAFQFALLFSCTFEPEGEHFVEVEPITSADFLIDIDNHGDTICIGEHEDITFKLDLGDRRNVQLVKLMIDDVEFRELSPPNLDFYIFGLDFETGYHIMEFIIYSNSGSGSLADKTGMELLVGSFFFVLYTDTAPAHKIAITHFENYKGRLKITWEKYERPNFEKYVLCKGYSLSHPDKYVVSIEDSDLNYAYDNNYIGGDETYWIEMHAYTSDSPPPTIGFDTTINLHTTKFIRVSKDPLTENVYVEWDTCKYDSGFYSYRIRAYSEILQMYDPREEFITDINVTKTSYEELPFGGPLDVVLTVSSKELNTATDTVTYLDGEKSLPFHFFGFHPELNKYYRIYDDTLHMYDEGIAELKTILPDIGDTHFDNVFFRKDHIYLLHGTVIHVYSSMDLIYQETIELKDILGDFDFTGFSSITENGIFVCQKNNRINPYTYDTLKMINLETRQVLMSKRWTRPEYENTYSISLDGKYFCLEEDIYEWNGNDYNLLKVHANLSGGEGSTVKLGYAITSNYQIVSLFDKSDGVYCIKYDIVKETVEEILTFNNASRFFDFDMLNNVIYAYSISEEGNIQQYLIDASDPRLLNPSGVAIIHHPGYRYLNDTLYSSNGYKRYLEF